MPPTIKTDQAREKAVFSACCSHQQQPSTNQPNDQPHPSVVRQRQVFQAATTTTTATPITTITAPHRIRELPSAQSKHTARTPTPTERERDPHTHRETTTSPAGKSSKPVVAIGRHNSPPHRAPFSTRAHPGHHDQKKRRTHCAISHHKSVFLVQPTVRNGPPVTIKAKTYYGQTEILAFQDSIL